MAFLDWGLGNNYAARAIIHQPGNHVLVNSMIWKLLPYGLVKRGVKASLKIVFFTSRDIHISRHPHPRSLA
jgi:hypothetical protein